MQPVNDRIPRLDLDPMRLIHQFVHQVVRCILIPLRDLCPYRIQYLFHIQRGKGRRIRPVMKVKDHIESKLCRPGRDIVHDRYDLFRDPVAVFLKAHPLKMDRDTDHVTAQRGRILKIFFRKHIPLYLLRRAVFQPVGKIDALMKRCCDRSVFCLHTDLLSTLPEPDRPYCHFIACALQILLII